MDQDTLQMILREAVRETATEVLQILLNADREAFLDAKTATRCPGIARGATTPASWNLMPGAWWTWGRWPWPCMPPG